MKRTLTDDAKVVAVRAHADQKYGEHAYKVHLESVVGVFERFGVQSQSVLAAGWLHDVVEDTNVTIEDLRVVLDGHETADVEATLAIVDACTDGAGKNRKERKERPYRLIPKTPHAILVKLADRIANTEASRAGAKRPLLGMYRMEHASFKARLAGHGGEIADAMWAHLESIVDV